MKSHEQSIYVFFTTHICIKKVHDVLKVDKILVIQDEEDKMKESDLFLYTQEMLIIILFNICIFLELINEVREMTAEIVSDFNDKSIICMTEIRECII